MLKKKKKKNYWKLTCKGQCQTVTLAEEDIMCTQTTTARKTAQKQLLPWRLATCWKEKKRQLSFANLPPSSAYVMYVPLHDSLFYVNAVETLSSTIKQTMTNTQMKR